MEYTFYFVNNSRVISEWRGCFETRETAERFADGAAIGAAMTTGEIGVYATTDCDSHAISRQLTKRRRNVLLAHLNA